MAKKNDTTFFENKLLDFVTAKDPMLEMLQWVMDKFMEIEVAHKTSFLRLNEFIQLNKIFIILCISYGYIFKTVIMC